MSENSSNRPPEQPQLGTDWRRPQPTYEQPPLSANLEPDTRTPTEYTAAVTELHDEARNAVLADIERRRQELLKKLLSEHHSRTISRYSKND